ncbi:MAG: PH domain-containing protein [Clostridia bacterium]|nr:PH domain-containing protein [Clostridia bacterium]
MQPNYVAKKSLWPALSFWNVALFWLVVPLIIIICKIVVLKFQQIEFYDQRVIKKSGVFSKKERQFVFTSVVSVSVDQSFWGRIFNYGDVRVDLIGKGIITANGISRPNELKAFVEQYISNENLQQIVTN